MIEQFVVQQPLHFHSSKRLSGLVAEAMLHLDEVFSAEIYARDTTIVLCIEAR